MFRCYRHLPRVTTSTSSTSHSNVPFPANSMPASPYPTTRVTVRRFISSTGSNTTQILGDNVLPPYPHVHARKSSLLIPAHTKTQIPQDTKHVAPLGDTSVNFYIHLHEIAFDSFNSTNQPSAYMSSFYPLLFGSSYWCFYIVLATFFRVYFTSKSPSPLIVFNSSCRFLPHVLF